MTARPIFNVVHFIQSGREKPIQRPRAEIGLGTNSSLMPLGTGQEIQVGTETIPIKSLSAQRVMLRASTSLHPFINWHSL